MTEQEIGALMLSTTLPAFITLSMGALAFAFAVKLIFEDSTFEHLKIMSTIVVLAFTIMISTELYKSEQVYGLKDRIIAIKTSSLAQDEKKEYIEHIDKDIESIKKLDINIIFGLAKFMIWGLIFIIIRDTMPKLIRLRKTKHNKSLERNSLP